MTAQPPNTETTPAENTGKGFFKIILWISVVLLIFLVLGAFSLFAAVFSESKYVPPEPLTKKDLKFQQKMIKRLTREVFSKSAFKESRLELKKSEIRMLFRLVDYGFSAAKLAGKYKGIEPRYFEPVFSPDQIQATYPQDTGQRWLFGGVLRWHIAGTLEFTDNKLNLKVHSARLGRVPFPKNLVEKFLLGLFEELYDSKDYAVFCDIVKKIYIKPDGSLVLVYHPVKLLPLLMF